MTAQYCIDFFTTLRIDNKAQLEDVIRFILEYIKYRTGQDIKLNYREDMFTHQIMNEMLNSAEYWCLNHFKICRRAISYMKKKTPITQILNYLPDSEVTVNFECINKEENEIPKDSNN